MLIDLPPFRPHPLVRGGHLQTVVGSYLPSPSAVGATLHRVPLPDGDAIALHDDGGLSNGNIAILIHGLGGCHQSGYMVRCSAKLRARGVLAFADNPVLLAPPLVIGEAETAMLVEAVTGAIRTLAARRHG